MNAEQELEHLRLRIQCMQNPAPQPRAGTDPKHQAGEAPGHTNNMPVGILISRKVLLLEGLGERKRLLEPQRKTFAGKGVDRPGGVPD